MPAKTFNLPIASGTVQLGGPAAWFFTGSTDPAVVLNSHLDGNQMGVQDLLDGGADGIYTLRCYCDQSNIVLDGGTPVGWTGVPVGFRVLTQLGNAYISEADTGTGHGLIPPTFQWFWQNFSFGAASNITPITDRNITSTLFAGSSPSLLSLFSVGFGLNFVTDYGSAGVGFRTGYVKIDFLEIKGTYDIIPNTWTLSPTAINIGDTVTISGLPDPSTLTPSIQYVDNNNVVQTIAVTTPSFVVPSLPNLNPTQPITVVAAGTQFSGTVVLGTLTITIVNGAGIYTIVSGATADTYYVNSTVGNTTAQAKIGDPFIKTAFLP